MPCDVIHTGHQFLSATLAHLDCQGRTIGSYGYGALADPGSSMTLALTGLLTIFVAIFGIRLLIERQTDTRDFVLDILRVGLFLTLATSWPAWRTLGYDLVLDGPGQVAHAIGLASGLPGSANDFVGRLQDADDGIVALTEFGSGRLTGGILAGGDAAEAARGIALADQNALGSGRATFLATIVGAFGLLRLASGLLLAIAPLIAGLVLFASTLPLFIGWLRGLAFCALGSLAFQIIASTELALLFPWLDDTLAQRQVNTFTPSAPTELLVLALAFAVITAGTLFLLAKITFLPVFHARFSSEVPANRRIFGEAAVATAGRATRAAETRAVTISASMAAQVERAAGTDSRRTWEGRRGLERTEGTADTAAHRPGPEQALRLGGSWRRASPRSSAAGRKRDKA